MALEFAYLVYIYVLLMYSIRPMSSPNKFRSQGVMKMILEFTH